MIELGRVLKRVWELQEEITIFVEAEGQMFSQLKYKNWKTGLAFVVEGIRHHDNSNVTIQGKDSHMHKSYAALKTFQEKVLLFSKQIKEQRCTHILHTKSTLASSSAIDK
jgi:hypothetical protein